MADPKALLKRYEPKQGKSIDLDRQINVLRFSPCGKFLAAGGCDGAVRRWDAAADEPKPLRSLTGHNGWVQAIAFHPDKERLFTADTWGEVRCWEYAAEEPKLLSTIKSAHDGWIRDLVVSSDGKLLATCGRDQKVRIWSVDGKKLHEFDDHHEDVCSLAFHPDSKSLVSGDFFGNVLHWNIAGGKKTREFDCKIMHTRSRLQDVGGVRRLLFDAAGKTLACAGTKPKNGGNVQGTPTILVFDWKSGKLQHTMSVGATSDGFVYDLAFHPDGFIMAVTSGNPGTGKFYFHRPADEKPFFLSTKMRNCHSLAVHPDGKRLIVSATNNGSNGNGRRLKDGKYPGNYSPLHLWDLPS